MRPPGTGNTSKEEAMPNIALDRQSIPHFMAAILVASLLAAGSLVSAPRALAAETTPPTTMGPGSDHDMSHHRDTMRQARMQPESVEHRIHELYGALKITPAQEAAWRGLAETMRENARRMERLIDRTRAEGPRGHWTALQSLEIYHRFAEAHDENLERLTTAFARLYHEMPPTQQRNADKVFREWHHHPRHH
jgi:LTXXQ motif family protein